MANREFVSGLPGDDLSKKKSFEQVITESRKAIIERRKLEERKRLYTSRMTPESLALTKRITGEKDD